MLTTRKLETLFVEALLDYTFTIYVKPDVIRLVRSPDALAPLRIRLYAETLALPLFGPSNSPDPGVLLTLHIVLNKLLET